MAACTIVSPIDGIIVGRNFDVGQVVEKSQSETYSLGVAANLQALKLEFTMKDAEAWRLSPGSMPSVMVASYPGERFVATVRQLRLVAGSPDADASYHATLDVYNPSLRLKPGMLAKVYFVYPERGESLAVNAGIEPQLTDVK